MVETAATIYQKDIDRFHLLLTEPPLQEQTPQGVDAVAAPRLLWLEVSPHRVIMTMQGNAHVSYRHSWEQGVYGTSRYWLVGQPSFCRERMPLRNFTRRLTLVGRPLPEHLRVEYELWSQKVQMGSYILNLEIHH